LTINTQPPQHGDAVFAHTNNTYGWVIRLGQAIRWWKYRSWNHMAYVDSVDEDGQIWVLQMARRCERVKIEDVAPKGHVKIIHCPPEVNREMATNYARNLIGTKYGVLTIVSVAINLLMPNPLRLDIRQDDTLICSGFVARAWEHGGWNCPVDPFQITPAEFDKILGGGGTQIY
jgi:hypothetical protein